MNPKQPHVLLIDDDPDMHEAVRVVLEPLGYRVTCCLTGPGGLQAMRREPPDLVLLDVMLSTPSQGFHLAYEIRSDDLLRRIPIVILSAIGATTGMDFRKELGTDYLPAEAFLEKPLSAEALRRAVQQALHAHEA